MTFELGIVYDKQLFRLTFYHIKGKTMNITKIVFSSLIMIIFLTGSTTVE